ncbi:MAG: hypothetical protein AAFP17_05755 [Pseudomonadota bacterium]
MNRDIIGPDPAALEVGTVLRLPCPSGTLGEAPVAASPEALRLAPDASAEAPSAPRSGVLSFVGAAAFAATLRQDRRLQVVDLRARRVGQTFVPRALSLPREAWPSAPPFRPFLARNGLDPQQPIALVAEDGSAEALARSAYAVWVLTEAGGRDVRLLIGGQAAYESRRRPLWAGPATPRPRRLLFDRSAEPTPVLPGAAEVLELGAGHDAQGALASLPTLPALAPLIREGRVQEAALAALSWAKEQPVPWEQKEVLLTAPTRDEAALAWMMLSLLAGVERVGLLPVGEDGVAGAPEGGGG